MVEGLIPACSLVDDSELPSCSREKMNNWHKIVSFQISFFVQAHD